ncbi:MAG TPA: GNAT family N-acetyltransferase [Microlunatus sp.]|nr:GNAT family N-acetyltransferase [Microlunatus sp.]
MDDAGLLSIYDTQLRELAEVATALRWQRHGPLFWATYDGGHGFVTYGPPGSLGHDTVDALVAATVAHFTAQPAITDVEWKTRGHDPLPTLDGSLRAYGFVPGEEESVMLGEAWQLAVDLPMPAGVSVRRISERSDVEAMARLADEVFGLTTGPDRVAEWVRRASPDVDETELWVAEANGRMVSAGRLDPVPGTTVAGIWGGGTLPAWRGRGIYRVLLAERARSALRRGCTVLHSDSTAYSRPILERSGFRRITTTTPYEWTRD